MWLDIGIEKVDIHKGIIVKVLLDSSTMRMFINREIAKRHGFRMMKLERPLNVKNVDRTKNSGGNITHQVEVNVFYKNHVERMRMDVCNLGKTEMILGMPWLQAHNPEINWETREVKMMRCSPLCRRNLAVKEDIEQRKKIRKRIRNVEKANRDKWKWTMKEKFNREIELDREKVKEIVSQRFHKWLKVFGKIKSERMPIRKPWDHTINLKEDFVPKKERTYLMSR